jgi:hypothetical protein
VSVKLGHTLENDESPSVVLSPDGAIAIVVFEDTGCDCRNNRDDGIATHLVLSVALATGAVDVVAKGNGTAAAAFDSDGQLWVQEDRKLTRHHDGTAALPHVLLAPGHVAKTYCCGL